MGNDAKTMRTIHHAPPEEIKDPRYKKRMRYALAVIQYLPEGGWYSGRHTHEWDKKTKQWVKA